MNIIKMVLNLVCLKLFYPIVCLNSFRMITDVIKAYEQPTEVVAKLCCKSFYKIELAKMLMRNKKPSNVKFLGDSELLNNIKPSDHFLFLVDANCHNSKQLLDQASAMKFYGKAYRWLVIGKIDIIIKDMAGSNILVDSEFIVAEEQDNKDFILKTIYKITSNSEWIIENYGTWTIDGGLNKSQDRMISNAMRRKDLRKTIITTSLIIADNRTMTDYGEVSNPVRDPVTKSTFVTIKYIYDMFNATKQVKFTDTWGHPDVNGTWPGMAGDLSRGEAELCGTIMFMSIERITVVEYIRAPASVPKALIVFRQPPLSYEHNLFVLPFTSGVWYSFGAFVIILILLLYVTTKWDIKKYQEKKIADATCLRATWSDIIIFILSAISQQGSSNELKGNRGRIVMFIMFLSFVFFYTSYSANIIVLLQSTSDKIRTIADLTNSKLEIGVENVSYNTHYFSEAYARDPIRKAFYETKVATKQIFMSLEDGVKRMQKKPFAFSMNVGSGYRLISKYFQEHEKCGLQEIDYIRSGNAMYCYKKYSPFSEMFRVGIHRFEEHGFSDKNNRRIFQKKPSCTVTGGNFESVKMVDFYPALLLLLYGMIVAFVFLVIEILFDRKQKDRRNLRE